MKYRLSLCFLFLGLFFYSKAQHTDVFPDLTGNELLTQLKIQYKPSAVLPYDQARDILFGQVDRVGDSLECIYSGHRIFLPFGQDPTTAAYNNGSNDGINTEHTYPQSLWNGGNSPLSDMHHLFPTRSAVNNARSSKPFADINDNGVDTWFYRNTELSSIPSSNIDLYAEDDNDSGYFEPRESVKGDIARAMFYFYTMYRNEANEVNTTFFQSQVATLCQWHSDDPVDAKELTRTWKIAEYQQNKPNPFVLDCTLVYRSNYCSGEPSPFCALLASPVKELDISKEISISPNPTNDYVEISFSENIPNNESIQIQLFDVSGKILQTETIEDRNSILLNMEEYPKGMFLLQIQTKDAITTKRLVHN